MSNPITIQLDACTVVAQRQDAEITFEFCAHAGAEPFTLTGPEFHRIVRAWSALGVQHAIEGARKLAAEAPPPAPRPKFDPLTRLVAWLRADVTGGAA